MQFNESLFLVRIGRDRTMDVCLADETVSRRHAELVVSPNNRCYLSDCLSTSGTFVERRGRWRRIEQEDVEFSDRVAFGDYVEIISVLIANAGGLRGRGEGAGGSSREDPLDGAAKIRRDPETGDLITD